MLFIRVSMVLEGDLMYFLNFKDGKVRGFNVGEGVNSTLTPHVHVFELIPVSGNPNGSKTA